MIANVNETLWVDFNLDTAVFLDLIAFWLKKNSLNKQPRNFRDGRYWTYNTLDSYCTHFPGWSKDTIRRIIRNCVKHGLLLVGNYNRKGYDRTAWYSLTDKALEYYPQLQSLMNVTADNPDSDSCGGSPTSCGGSNTAIPTLLPTSSNNTITAIAAAGKAKRDSDKELILREMIDAYRETFPDNPQPHKTAISTSLEKTLLTLITKWPKVHPTGQALTIGDFTRYLLDLKLTAPKFSLGTYITPEGARKKNNLETFCRWNTVVKHFEEAYT